MLSMLIGLAVGLVMGLTGGGGSVFAVPLLITLLRWPFNQAATVSLLAVGLAATVGTAISWRHSNVRYRAALLMAFVGLMFSYVGIHVANDLPESTLKFVFSLVLGIVSIRMYLMTVKARDSNDVVQEFTSGDSLPFLGRVGKLNPITGRLVWTHQVATIVSCIGAVTGFLSGLLGVGGGFLIVPAIRAILPLSMHTAVSTSLMTLALTSSGTFIFALIQGRSVPFSLASPFVIGTILGITIGRLLAPKISGPSLQKTFALLAFGVSIAMAAQTTLTMIRT